MALDPIPFNRPTLAGKEEQYPGPGPAEPALVRRRGPSPGRSRASFERRYGFQRVLLTPSCTAALEMAAILTGVGPGDEVILPSYTFVLHGQCVRPARRHSRVRRQPGLAPQPGPSPTGGPGLPPGPRCWWPCIMVGWAAPWDRSWIWPDAGACWWSRTRPSAWMPGTRTSPWGGSATWGTFSFHETKNISSGEGGALVLNDSRFLQRAEIIREKGTNRRGFLPGARSTSMAGWTSAPASCRPNSRQPCLRAQMEEVDAIQARRVAIWNRYQEGLAPLATRGDALPPTVPGWSDRQWPRLLPRDQ